MGIVQRHPQSYCLKPVSSMLERLVLQLQKLIQTSIGVDYERKISYMQLNVNLWKNISSKGLGQT